MCSSPVRVAPLSLIPVVSKHALLVSERWYRDDDDGERQYSRCGMVGITCYEHFDLDHAYLPVSLVAPRLTLQAKINSIVPYWPAIPRVLIEASTLVVSGNAWEQQAADEALVTIRKAITKQRIPSKEPRPPQLIRYNLSGALRGSLVVFRSQGSAGTSTLRTIASSSYGLSPSAPFNVSLGVDNVGTH